MEQTTAHAEQAAGKKKNVWLPVGIILILAAAVVALLALGTRALHKNGSHPAPVMLAQSSHFSMYEERPDEVLLTYCVTLRNDTDEDLGDFALRAVLQSDYKKGYLLSPDAKVRMWGEQYSTFSLAAGETKTYDLILTAKFHKTQRTRTGDLPQLFAVFPDGSEGRIEIIEK
jgi:hypothetical protein